MTTEHHAGCALMEKTGDTCTCVHDSCGCVFCDLDLPTHEAPDGFKRMTHWHHTKDGDVRCTRKS